MTIHLIKSINIKGNNIELERMACVNSPFIKGRIVSNNEFLQAIKENPGNCCKKCIKIFNKSIA